MQEKPRDPHLCPPWIGYLLLNPLRNLIESPKAILGPLVQPGMTVVDMGSAMGFFSLPLARMVGRQGRVVCVDVQPGMLERLSRRARRRGLASIVETRLATQESAGLDDLQGQVDLMVCFHVIHEAVYPQTLIQQCADALKPGGKIWVSEPKGHVSREAFKETVGGFHAAGLRETPHPMGPKSHAALLIKSAE